MKRQRILLLIYLIISQQILSSAKYLDSGILSQYPYANFLENLLETYDKLNGDSIYSMIKDMDPGTLLSISEDIGKIIKLGKTGIDSIANAGESLYSGIKSLGGNSKNAIFYAINFLKNHPAITVAGVAGVLGVYLLVSYAKSKINDSNEYYKRLIYEIKNLIAHKKYTRIIENNIGDDLQNIIEKGISNLYLTKYIIDYLNKDNIFEMINNKFNQKIDSLDFILLGDTGVGKSTLLNKILELNPEDNGAYVNEDFADPTTMEFKKFNNENKTGIELIDSRGIESNNNYNAKDFIGNFTNYFENKLIESNSNFIYGIIFMCETDSFSEIDTLKDLKNIFNNKIPLKLLYSKGKADSQAKRINNTIKSKISDIKPYFLKTTSNGDYEKNLNDFLKELLEELNEDKLKDIYQYYYSLDIFNNFQFILEKINAEQNMLKYSGEIKKIKKMDPIERIMNNLDFDLKLFLLEEYINLDDIKKGIKELYNSFENELNEDLKNIKKEENYALKKYEDRGRIDKIIEWINDKHLPYDIMAQGISQKINEIILNKFLTAIQKEILKNPIKVRNYPDFASIKNTIEKNFIKIQDKTNTIINTNINTNIYSKYKSIAIIIFIIAFIIAFIIIFKKCFYKKKAKEKKQDQIELVDYEKIN